MLIIASACGDRGPMTCGSAVSTEIGTAEGELLQDGQCASVPRRPSTAMAPGRDDSPPMSSDVRALLDQFCMPQRMVCIENRPPERESRVTLSNS
jgi:hypothetical protein